MRYEFMVEGADEAWRVRSGMSQTPFATQQSALAAAVNLAKSMTDRGDRGVVFIKSEKGVTRYAAFGPADRA